MSPDDKAPPKGALEETHSEDCVAFDEGGWRCAPGCRIKAPPKGALEEAVSLCDAGLPPWVTLHTSPASIRWATCMRCGERLGMGNDTTPVEDGRALASFAVQHRRCSDKAPPKGALEEAVSLFDELRALLSSPEAASYIARHDALADLDSRRAALEPRLAKRRENQAKGRGDKP